MRSFHESGPLTRVIIWSKIKVIWSDHLSIKIGYDGGPEGKDGSDFIWDDDTGMMRDMREHQMRGTETEGFWIWEINI